MAQNTQPKVVIPKELLGSSPQFLPNLRRETRRWMGPSGVYRYDQLNNFKIQVNAPSMGSYIDPKSLRINFQVSIDASLGTGALTVSDNLASTTTIAGTTTYRCATLLQDSAYSFFNKLTVYGNDGQMTSTNWSNYSQLMNAINDLWCSNADRDSMRSETGVSVNVKKPNGVAYKNNYVLAYASKTANTSLTSFSSSESPTQSFSLPIVSDIYLMDQYLPIGYLSGISFEFFLNNDLYALTSIGMTTPSNIKYKLSNVYISADVITSNDNDLINMMSQAIQAGGVSYHSESYFLNTLTLPASSISSNLSWTTDGINSLKGFLVMSQLANNVGSNRRDRDYLSQVRVKINGVDQYGGNPLLFDDTASVLRELLKMRGSSAGIHDTSLIPALFNSSMVLQPDIMPYKQGVTAPSAVSGTSLYINELVDNEFVKAVVLAGSGSQFMFGGSTETLDSVNDFMRTGVPCKQISFEFLASQATSAQIQVLVALHHDVELMLVPTGSGAVLKVAK